jgi:broad-specificity NMP kinase
VFALLLTGPPGAGKSEVATALHDSLGDTGISNALVEVDQLERCHPPLSRELAIAHLALLSGSLRAAGYDLLLITATVEDDAYAEAVLDAAGTEEHLFVRLEAGTDTLERRLLAREPQGWSGLTALIESSRRLAESMRSLSGVTLVLSTEGEEPEQVATRLRAALHPALAR